MGAGHAEEKDPGELIGIQRLLSPGSRMMCPEEQEIEQRWQETCMDE